MNGEGHRHSNHLHGHHHCQWDHVRCSNSISISVFTYRDPLFNFEQWDGTESKELYAIFVGVKVQTIFYAIVGVVFFFPNAKWSGNDENLPPFSEFDVSFFSFRDFMILICWLLENQSSNGNSLEWKIFCFGFFVQQNVYCMCVIYQHHIKSHHIINTHIYNTDCYRNHPPLNSWYTQYTESAAVIHTER